MRRLSFYIILATILFLPVELAAQERIDKSQAITVSDNYYRSVGIASEQIIEIEEDYLNDTLCLYCIHYSDGRWTIVSASKRAFPILALGEDSNMTLLNNDNPSFNSHIWRYKRSILDADNAQARELTSADSIIVNDMAKRWDSLLFNEKGLNSIVIDYIHGVNMLSIPGRGTIKWGQDKNNDLGCSPSYNMYCMYDPYLLDDCDCNRPPVGCAPVAMGQVMWYWQWPLYSPEDEQLYKWEIMPPELRDTTNIFSADNIARLLNDLGNNMNAIYSCFGTAVLPGNIEGGFADFGYQTVDRRKRSNWRYGYSWTELVRTEIDNNRPVVIYGEDGTIFNGHYFVIDGYSLYDNNLFHINWGWLGSDGFYNLYATTYSDNMSAYVGISPSYLSSEILQEYHDGNNKTTYLYSVGDLDLPDNHVSTIESGENVIINAGMSIDLMPGFEASAGSDVTIEIDEYLQSTFNIAILGFPDFDNILVDGAIMKAANANSFECTVNKVGDNDPIYQHSGSIRDNTALIWDGSNFDPNADYRLDVTFRNNFGMKYNIVFYHYANDAISMPMHESNESILNVADSYTYIMPNPAREQVTVASSFVIREVEVFTLTGKLALRQEAGDMATTVDISSLPAGTYMVRIQTTKGTAFKKLVVR